MADAPTFPQRREVRGGRMAGKASHYLHAPISVGSTAVPRTKRSSNQFIRPSLSPRLPEPMRLEPCK